MIQRQHMSMGEITQGDQESLMNIGGRRVLKRGRVHRAQPLKDMGNQPALLQGPEQALAAEYPLAREDEFAPEGDP